MEKKLIILFLATICLVEVLGAPASRTLETDKQNAQYGIVKLVSEVNILRMRAYLLVIDVNHVIKNKNAELFTNMLAAGVPLTKIDKIKADTKTDTLEINTVYFKVMDNANNLMEQLYAMNNHITYTPTMLTSDMDLLDMHLRITQQAYDDSVVILTQNVDIFKLSVNTELAAVPASPEVTAANNLLVEMETLLNTGKAECNEIKLLVDATSVDTTAAVNTYIANNIP